MKTDSAQIQYDKMTKTPVNKLVLQLGLPTTVSMLVTSVYILCKPARNQCQRCYRSRVRPDGYYQCLRLHVRTWRRQQYQP